MDNPDAQEGRAKYLTVPEVAALLRVPSKWVYRKTSDGTLPHIKMGGFLRFRLETIEAWMRSCES